MKMCSKCKKLKPVSNFYKNVRANDGLNSMCKECCKEYYKEYNVVNKKRRAETNKMYYEINKERLDKLNNKYREEHLSQIHAQQRYTYNTSKTEILERHKKFIHSKKGKELQRRINYKRRKWGYKPLNKPFNGAEFHHLHKDLDGNDDHDIGIYIPKELHRSVYHNWATWQGMEIINKLVLEWYALTENTSELSI